MKINKKAAMELSINSIVILILAITMLGIGLGFMSKTFGSLIGKVGDVSADLDKQMKEKLKDSGERLVLQLEKIELKKSKERAVAFALKNDISDATFKFSGGTMDSTGTTTGESVAECYQSFNHPDDLPGIGSADGTTNEGASTTSKNSGKYIEIVTPGPMKIKQDESKTASIIVRASSKAESDTYQCSMVIMEPNTELNDGSVSDSEYARVDFEVVVS